MRFRVPFWLALVPLLAASAVGSSGRQSSSPASARSIAATKAPLGDETLRASARITGQIIGRSGTSHAAGGTATVRSDPPAQCIGALDLECALVRLAALRVSFATAAHGGPLIHFPTAPPVHG